MVQIANFRLKAGRKQGAQWLWELANRDQVPGLFSVSNNLRGSLMKLVKVWVAKRTSSLERQNHDKDAPRIIREE
jgi:hypothetical protein